MTALFALRALFSMTPYMVYLTSLPENCSAP